MSKKPLVSKAVIRRLPRYYRYFRELMEQGIVRVSSTDLSNMMKTTASQIRQDLSFYGDFGQQGYGYNVEDLYYGIGEILGTNTPHNVIVIGAGNLGRALVKYKGFSDHGFNFCALFDIDGDLCGKSVAGVKIHNINQLEKFIKSHEIDIAVITLPREYARDMAKRLYATGIRNYLNFSHTDLHLSDDTIVKNIHLLDAFLELSYEMKES